MVVAMAVEVSGVAGGAVARAAHRRAVAVDPGDKDAGYWGMAEGTGANGAVAVNLFDEVTAVAGDAESDTCHPAVILHRMIDEVGGVGAVAVGAGGGGESGDGVDHLLPATGMAGGAGIFTTGWDVVQGNDLSRGGE